MPSKPSILIAAIAGLISLGVPVQGQITGYEFSSLIMGFNATGGQGDTFVVTVSLGPAFNYRDATSNISNIVNLNSLLVNTYGALWYDRTDLSFGLGTTSSNISAVNDPTLINGDPGRTVYVTKARTSVGNEQIASSTVNTPNITQIGNSASNFQNLQNRFASNGGPATLSGSIGGGTAFSETLTNTWEEFTPAPSAVHFSFVTAPGVVQSFAPLAFGTFSTGSVEGALDLYRHQAANNVPGQFGEGLPNFTGRFEGIFTIDQSGNVSFIAPVPEPSTALLFGGASILLGAIRRRRR